MKTIEVSSCPWESTAEEARLQMRAAARDLHVQAAEAHFEGMSLESQSARAGQLAEVLSDEEVIRMRDLFVAEGLIRIDGGVDVSSPGGEA